MASTKESQAGGSLLGSIRNSPETKRLTGEARHLMDAQLHSLGGKLGGVTDKLSEIGESGQLPAFGKAAKGMAEGKGPVKSVLGAATSGIGDKAKGLLGGGGGGKKGGSGKAVNIEESIDIGAPASKVYDQWTQFSEFSQFMKGVESVDQKDDTEANWRVKVFKSRRSYNAKIQEQIPDERIVWTSEGGKGSTKGVVTFHPLGENLTRVLVAIEYFPSGFMEKTGNIWRAAGRRTRLDLKNFRRFVMMENEPTGSWRGEIHEGEVTKSPEENEQEGGGEEHEGGGEERPQRRARRRRGGDEGADEGGGGRRPAKKQAARLQGDEERPSGRKAQPAKKQQARKQQPSGEDRPRKRQAARKEQAPRKESARKQQAPARKQSAGRPAAKKQSGQRPPAKKQAAKKQPAKKAASRSRSSR